MTTDTNTWSHQRRKRREVFKDKEDPSTKDGLKTNTPVVDKTLITNSETFLGNSEVKERQDGSADTVSLQDATLSQPLTVPSKRKIEDEENVECSSSQKLKTEDCESTESMESSSVCPEPQTESKKRKREIENPSEISVSQKLKVENTVECGDLVSQEFQVNCSEGTSSNQIKSDSQISSEGTKIGMDLKDKLKASVIFEPKSLLFCTLKIRKFEDHLLLEMNCLPEANRESMHQIFQFSKNKLVNW